MRYTGKYRTMDSAKYGRVNILEYRSDSSIPYEECSRCGQLIRRKMFVVQDMNDVEIEYLGSECIKHFI